MPNFTIQLDTLHAGFDHKTCWVHARAGVVPGDPPAVVVTVQPLLLSGSDVFFTMHGMRSDDLGTHWTGPLPHDTLARRQEPDGVEVVICDFTPKWHAASGKLLGTGHTARYLGDALAPNRRRETAYSVYDPDARGWSSWAIVDMPDRPEFANAGAGSVQRVDLPGGDVLIPIYAKRVGTSCYDALVMRCAFDGQVLRYVEHGAPLSLDVPRGFGEPSLTRCDGRWFLTLRNDLTGYVAPGTDGLNFDPPRPWTFDDGESLGNYNTQQHWVTHAGGLFLVYTRRGAGNDHVFRHRAPLFIARVDPDRLCVLRDTERVLVPERGARLGNFGVTDVSPDETWVVVTEWMQPVGCEKHGSDNSIFAARIRWDQPNALYGKQ